MAREEVVSMAIEQVTRSDSVLQAKLAALKRDRIRAEAGRCLFCPFLYSVGARLIASILES
jgi:hypothetical protein